MAREIKDTISVKVSNNTAFTQNVNLLGGTSDPLGVPPHFLYQWDLSSESYVGTVTAKIIISNTSNPTPITYIVQVTQLNVQGVAYALNTLNMGIFRVNGNIIYISNDYYIYGALSVSGTTILGTTGTNPTGLVVNSLGNVYTANSNSNDVSQITKNGVSTVFSAVGNVPLAIVIDSAGNLYTADSGSNQVSKVTPLGVSSVLGFTSNVPQAITIDSLGNIYTANAGGNNITKITPLGVSTNYGNLNFENPQGMVIDSLGNIFVVCSANVVKKITPLGVSTNFGLFTLGNILVGIAIDALNNIYISDSTNSTIYKLTPLAVQTVYGVTPSSPKRITIDNSSNIYSINQDGTIIKTLAIGGNVLLSDLSVYSGSPYAIALDSIENIYVTDYINNVVYLIVQ